MCIFVSSLYVLLSHVKYAEVGYKPRAMFEPIHVKNKSSLAAVYAPLVQVANMQAVVQTKTAKQYPSLPSMVGFHRSCCFACLCPPPPFFSGCLFRHVNESNINSLIHMYRAITR